MRHMGENPYQSPATGSDLPRKESRQRYLAVYIVVALLGAFAAFVLTAPMGAIDGTGCEAYWISGAVLPAILYRVLWS